MLEYFYHAPRGFANPRPKAYVGCRAYCEGLEGGIEHLKFVDSLKFSGENTVEPCQDGNIAAPD